MHTSVELSDVGQHGGFSSAHEIADIDLLTSDPSADGRSDFGVAEVEFGAGDLRASAFDGRQGEVAFASPFDDLHLGPRFTFA